MFQKKESLDLIGRELYKKTGKELALFFLKAHPRYTSLLLLGNDFYLMENSDLAIGFAGIKYARHLNISKNNWFKKTSASMVTFLLGLPPQVEKITLTLADIKDMKDEELIDIAYAMPFVKKICIVNEKGNKVKHPAADALQKYLGIDIDFDWIRTSYHLIQEKSHGLNQDLSKLILSFATPLVEEEIQRRCGFFDLKTVIKENYFKPTQNSLNYL